MRKINYNRFKYFTNKENYAEYIKSLDNNFDFNVVDKYKETILTAAIHNKNLEFVKWLLLKKNVDINGDRKAKYYPLEIACLISDLNIVELLCKSPLINLNRDDDHSMIFASTSGDVNIIEILIKKGWNLNKVINGRTVLHWAIQAQHIEVVKLLINTGACVNFDKYGYDDDEVENSPLRTALSEYSLALDNGEKCIAVAISILDILLGYGANINAFEEDGSTILIDAICMKCDKKLIEFLLRKGAYINATDREGRTALFYAKLRKQNDVAKMLIDNKADLTVVDTMGISLAILDDEEKRKKIFIEWYYPEEDTEYDVFF